MSFFVHRSMLTATMLPLVDTNVLLSNPKFEALYNDLCTNKLNKDGTSKLDVKAQREHDALQQVHDCHRMQMEKRNIRDLILTAGTGVTPGSS